MHQALVVPLLNGREMGAPLRQVLGEARALVGDIGAGLLQRQGQAVELFGQGGGVIRIARELAAPLVAALQEELCRILGRENVELQRFDIGAPLREPARHEHRSAAQLGEQPLGGRGSLLGVDVVQDQEPAGVLVQPAQGRSHAHLFFGGLLLGQIEHQWADQGGEVAAQVLGAVGHDEEQGAIVRFVLPGVLDGEAGLAHTSEPVQRLTDDGRGMAVHRVSEALA